MCNSMFEFYFFPEVGFSWGQGSKFLPSPLSNAIEKKWPRQVDFFIYKHLHSCPAAFYDDFSQHIQQK